MFKNGWTKELIDLMIKYKITASIYGQMNDDMSKKLDNLNRFVNICTTVCQALVFVIIIEAQVGNNKITVSDSLKELAIVLSGISSISHTIGQKFEFKVNSIKNRSHAEKLYELSRKIDLIIVVQDKPPDYYFGIICKEMETLLTIGPRISRKIIDKYEPEIRKNISNTDLKEIRIENTGFVLNLNKINNEKNKDDENEKKETNKKIIHKRIDSESEFLEVEINENKEKEEETNENKEKEVEINKNKKEEEINENKKEINFSLFNFLKKQEKRQEKKQEERKKELCEIAKNQLSTFITNSLKRKTTISNDLPQNLQNFSDFQLERINNL